MIEGNQPLARAPKSPTPDDPAPFATVIETRGEGGIALTPYSRRAATRAGAATSCSGATSTPQRCSPPGSGPSCGRRQGVQHLHPAQSGHRSPATAERHGRPARRPLQRPRRLARAARPARLDAAVPAGRRPDVAPSGQGRRGRLGHHQLRRQQPALRLQLQRRALGPGPPTPSSRPTRSSNTAGTSPRPPVRWPGAAHGRPPAGALLTGADGAPARRLPRVAPRPGAALPPAGRAPGLPLDRLPAPLRAADGRRHRRATVTAARRAPQPGRPAHPARARRVHVFEPVLEEPLGGGFALRVPSVELDAAGRLQTATFELWNGACLYPDRFDPAREALRARFAAKAHGVAPGVDPVAVAAKVVDFYQRLPAAVARSAGGPAPPRRSGTAPPRVPRPPTGAEARPAGTPTRTPMRARRSSGGRRRRWCSAAPSSCWPGGPTPSPTCTSRAAGGGQ